MRISISVNLRLGAPLFAAHLVLLLVACGGGGDGGSGIDFAAATNAKPCPVPSSAANGGPNSGVAVDALTCAPIAGVKVTANLLGEATTGADGSFKFSGATPTTKYSVTLNSVSTVPRTTSFTPSGAPRVFSLIPNSFNLPAFDEMLRLNPNGLLRWTQQAPTLIVQRQVIDYSTEASDPSGSGNISGRSYVATQTTVPDDLAARAIERVQSALPQLSSYSAFTGVRIETAAPGSRVSEFGGVGTIVVAWATNFPANAQGVVPAGIANFTGDFSNGIRAGRAFVSYERAADVPVVLIHEFGHALGYLHTDLTSSLMNRSNGPLPTTFDLQSAKIANDRPLGNKSPDIDP